MSAVAAGCGRHGEQRQPSRTEQLPPVLTSHPRGEFDGRLRVATVFPTIGRYGVSGLQSQRGALMAAEEVNARGGIHGRPVQVLEYGTGSFFTDAALAAQLAAEEGDALAIVGSNSSSLSKAVADVAEERGVPQVSNISTARDLTWDPATGADRRFVFRMCASDVVMGRRLADFAWRNLGVRRVAVLYEIARDYSSSLAAAFVEAFARYAGRQAVAEYLYLPLETDFRPQIRRAAAFGAQALLVPGSFTDGTLVATQAARLDLEAILLGGDGWSSPLLFSTGGPSRPAFHVELCVVPPSFQERYLRRFGGERATCRALLAHEAMSSIAAALRALGPLDDAELEDSLPRTRDRLREALSRVDTLGESGRIRFDEHGDAVRGVAIVEVAPTAAGYRTTLERWLGPR